MEGDRGQMVFQASLTWSQHGWTRRGEVGCGLTGRTNMQRMEPVMAVWVWCCEKKWKMEVSTQNILQEHICKSSNWEYKVAWIKTTWSIAWYSSERNHGDFPQMAESLRDIPVWCKTDRTLPSHMKNRTVSCKGLHGPDRKLPSALYSTGQQTLRAFDLGLISRYILCQ